MGFQKVRAKCEIRGLLNWGRKAYSEIGRLRNLYANAGEYWIARAAGYRFEQ